MASKKHKTSWQKSEAPRNQEESDNQMQKWANSIKRQTPREKNTGDQ